MRGSVLVHRQRAVQKFPCIHPTHNFGMSLTIAKLLFWSIAGHTISPLGNVHDMRHGVIQVCFWTQPRQHPEAPLATTIVTDHHQGAIRKPHLSPALRYSEAQLYASHQIVATVQVRSVRGHRQSGIWGRPWSPLVRHSRASLATAKRSLDSARGHN